jgi:hypothetical protein
MILAVIVDDQYKGKAVLLNRSLKELHLPARDHLNWNEPAKDLLPVSPLVYRQTIDDVDPDILSQLSFTDETSDADFGDYDEIIFYELQEK